MLGPARRLCGVAAVLAWLVAGSADAQQPTAVRRRARPVVQDTVRPGEARQVAGARDSAAGARASGPVFPEPDSVMQMLLERAGYVPVQYRAESVRFDAGRRAIELWGNAEIERLGDRLAADSVVYVDTAALMTAYPPVTLTNAAGQVVEADSVMVYHTETRRSTVLGARTVWGEWFVSGNATLEGQDTLWVSHGSFTSCDLEEPHYHFAADRMKLVMGHVVVAWPVRLYFGDVPVFWFPFFLQDIRRGRHSGVLPPRFGINDVVRQSRGHRRSVENAGYYWAINDYTDAQVNLDWISGIYTKIDGFFRYTWRRKFLSGSLGYSHTFRQPSGEVLSLTWNHDQRLSERADVRTSIQYSSNADFVRSTTREPLEAIQEFRSDAVFNRRFDWGTLVVGAQRVQSTSRSLVTWNAPNVSLTLKPMTLVGRRDRGLNWSGSAAARQQIQTQEDTPERRNLSGNATSNFSLGPLQLNTSGRYSEDREDAPDTLITTDTVRDEQDTVTIVQDTAVLGPTRITGLGNWDVSLGYRQRLVGSTTFTPALALGGAFFRSRETDLGIVHGPTRLSARASLSADLYTFFPGVGSLRRIRHRVSPVFQWTYAPEVRLSEELRRIRGFPRTEVKEQHQLSMTLSQTFEAKLRPREGAPAVADTAGAAGAADTVPADTLQRRAAPRERKITLLSVQTSAIVYDFVKAREPGQSGLVTDRLSNSIVSDLLRGLRIQMEHDLFAEKPDGGRDFDPFLSGLNFSFSLGRGAPGPGFFPAGGLRRRTRGILPEVQPPPGGREPAALGEEAAGAPQAPGAPAGGAGQWNLSLNYNLLRTRPTPDAPNPPDRQSIDVLASLTPTPNWQVRWSTTYDFEEKRFLQQIITLQRNLHDWVAQFHFSKTVTGNFVFDFTVSLIAAPDIKFDYRQQSLPAAAR